MSEHAKMAAAVLLTCAAIGICYVRISNALNMGQSEFTLIPARQAAPAQNLTLVDAQTHQSIPLFSAARRQPVVLDFWATWCGPCRAELPQLSAVARRFHGRVAFYGVNSNDSQAAIVAFSKQNHLPFTTLVDTHHTAAAEYGANAIPHLAVIDAQGRLRLSVIGYNSSLNFKKIFEPIVKKASGRELSGINKRLVAMEQKIFSRREFLRHLTIISAGAALPLAAVAASAAPGDGFLVGTTASFLPGVVHGVNLPGGRMAYVQRLAGDKPEYLALNAACTHRGCPVNWNADQKEFICPCHGGRYDQMGKNISGPPPRPLYTLTTKVEDGNLYIV